MGKIAFLVMTSPYSFQNSDTVLKLAHAALKAGHEVIGIYLYTEWCIHKREYNKTI